MTSIRDEVIESAAAIDEAEQVGDEDRWIENMMTFSLLQALTCYRIDNHPMHLWNAYRICDRSGAPLPWVVQEYLSEVADLLCSNSEIAPEGRNDTFIKNTITRSNRNHYRDTWKRSFLILDALEMNNDLRLTLKQKKKLGKDYSIGDPHPEDTDTRVVDEWLQRAREILNENLS